LDQGFDLYDDDFASSAKTAVRRQRRMDVPGFWIGHDYLDFERSAAEVTDRALSWLRERRGERWFLFTHYFDPHWPYEPESTLAEEFSDPYDAEITYADRHLERLLDAVASMPGRTLVIFTADHGEGLGDHGERLHNRYVYNSTLQIPLVVSLPGLTRGKAVEGAVGQVDLLPTMLELLGIAIPSALPGRSLVPVLAHGGVVEARPLYAESLVWSLERPMGIEVRALIDGDFKLIETRHAVDGQPVTTRELYDVRVDQAERVDRAPFDTALAASLAERLASLRRTLEEEAMHVEPLDLDDAARARLRALGYL
jgi:arylsulfatase A-like enzyme